MYAFSAHAQHLPPCTVSIRAIRGGLTSLAPCAEERLLEELVTCLRLGGGHLADQNNCAYHRVIVSD